jgi:hypothetical protein
VESANYQQKNIWNEEREGDRGRRRRESVNGMDDQHNPYSLFHCPVKKGFNPQLISATTGSFLMWERRTTPPLGERSQKRGEREREWSYVGG